MISEGFKQFLKEDGRSIKWFYDSKIKDKVDIGYSGFAAQLNGYASLSDDVKVIIVEFMSENDNI